MPRMRNDCRTCYAVAFATFIFAFPAYAQNTAYQPRPARTYSTEAGRTLTAPSTASPASIVAAFLGERGVSVSAASLVRVGDPDRGEKRHHCRPTRAGRRRACASTACTAEPSLTSRGELVQLIENLLPQAPTPLPRRVSTKRRRSTPRLAGSIRASASTRPRSGARDRPWCSSARRSFTIRRA